MNTNKTTKGFDQGKYNFVGQIGKMFWFSNIITILSLVAIFGKGLNYGIDFKGGTEVQIKFKEKLDDDDATLRKFLTEQGLEHAQLQRFGTDNEYLIRFEPVHGKADADVNALQKERVQKITTGLATSFPTQGPEIRRVDSVGPQVGDMLKRNGILALFYSLVMILIYIGLRFDYEFAPGAVVCLFHDVVIVVGVFAIMGKEVNAAILAAVLTIIGYDINDTIIIYDRIRENMKLFKGVPLSQVINRSINDTLHRSILTHTTTMLSCLALIFISGGVIADFAFAFALGIIFGTYSSIYVAAPLVLYLENFKFTKKPKAVTA